MNRPSAATRTLEGHSDRRPVTSLAVGRTTTWMYALWTAYIATWAVVSGSGPAVVAAWWLAGLVLWQAIVRSMARPAAADDGAYVPEPALDAGPASNR